MASWYKANFLVWLLLLGSQGGIEGAPTVHNFQAEKGQGFNSSDVHWRSNATEQQAVWLREGETLSINFCLPRNDNVTVEEVRFSSDGYEKTVSVLIDGKQVGAFNTFNNSNYGLNWNEFNTSAPSDFEAVSLNAGKHTIEIVLSEFIDAWGIEIDSVSASFGNNVTAADLACEDVTEKPEET